MAVSIGQTSLVSDGLVLHLDPSVTYNYILSEVEVLVVAGGGGGGGWGGGGGGGGVVYNRLYPVTPGTAISITIGNGGVPGTTGYTSGGDGGNSIFGNITAIGGGGGGHYNSVNGRAGGSGGGGGGAESNTYGFVTTGGSGTLGQGNNGGRGGGRPGAGNYYPGGGGGGAGEPGYNFDVYLGLGGKGGDGLPFNISGRLRYYGGGGGGHTDGGFLNDGNSMGGKGGGGRGGTYRNLARRGLDGAANTGGGGGGSYGAAGGYECGAGGTGVVIVRYLGPPKATGGNTITQVDGYTIHTFTSSGTFTPSSAPANSGAINGLQDLSNNYNTGTQVGGVTYSSANGGSLSFDGVDDYVNCGAINFTSGTSITVEVWAKPNSSQNAFADILDYNHGAGGGFVIQQNGNATNQYYFAYWNGSNFDVTSTITLNSNSFNHLVFVKSGTSTIGYLNSVNTIQYTGSLNINGSGYVLHIGRFVAGAGREFNGNISQVSIYNRALTSQEIQQNFNALRGRFGI